MRFARSLVLASCAALSVSLSGVATGAAGEYVALGDSYSAGAGAGSYSGGTCYRSANAYPVLWANVNKPSKFTFVACGGAVTGDVINGQVNSLSSSTALVSISIGGNDVGFGDVIQNCIAGSDQQCVDAVNRAKDKVRNELPAKLDATYAAIKAKAPNAQVVVLGYPRIFNSSACWWIGATKKDAVNSGADLLSQATAERAAAAGVKYEDVRDNFAGHEICASSPWINAVVFDFPGSFHPNRDGHAKAYYPAFEGVA